MNLLSRIYELNNKNASFFSSLIKKIALISISFGLFSVIVSSFVLDGFKKEIKNKIYSFSGHYDISSYSNGLSFKNSPLNLNDGVNTNYKELETIESIHPYILNSALFQGDKRNIEGVIFKGVDRSYISQIESFFDEYNNEIDFRTSILISADLAKKLFVNLNDTVTVFFPNDPPVFRRLKVKGIFSTGLEEIDNLVAFGDIQLSRKIYQWKEENASGIHVFLKNYNEDDVFIDKLKEISSYDEYIESTKSKYVQIFDWLALLDKNVIVFFIIVVIVACFNMLSIVFIIIMEKTSLVGTLKSFGARKKLIYSLSCTQTLPFRYISGVWPLFNNSRNRSPVKEFHMVGASSAGKPAATAACTSWSWRAFSSESHDGKRPGVVKYSSKFAVLSKSTR